MAVNPLQDVKSDLTDVTGTASAGAVTAVTGLAPIVSSGTTTPQISLTVPLSNQYGGSSSNLSATGGAGQYVKQAGVGAAFTVGTIPSTDVGTGAVLADGTVPLTANWNTGTASTGFTVQSQNSVAWFNVKASYAGGAPAVGNGIASDTAAVQRAITAAQAVNGTVYFPAGSYNCGSGSLTITSQIVLRGDGVLATTILLPTASDGFVINSIAASQRNVAFFDMQFMTASVASAGAFIHCNGAANFPLTVFNCNFYTHFVGIQMESNWGSYISTNQFLTAVATGTDIWVNNLVQQDQGDNQIFENTFWSNGAYNIRQTAGGGTRILGNKFVGPAGYSIYLDTPNPKSTGVLLIEANSLEGNVSIANIGLAPAGTFSNVVIQNNEFEGTSGQSAILIQPTATGSMPRGLITNNTFYNCAKHVDFSGAAGAGSVDKWMVIGNVFDSATTATIALPATAGNVTNLKIGRNNVIQSTTAPYVSGAFSASSSFDPGIETLYTQTADKTTVANTLSSFFASVPTVQAGRFMVGTTIEIEGRGVVAVATPGGIHGVRVYLNGTIISVGSTVAAQTSAVATGFAFRAHITCRATGGSGTAAFVGGGEFTTATAGTGVPFIASGNSAAIVQAPLTTTGTNTVDVQLNNNNVTGTYTCTSLTVKIIN